VTVQPRHATGWGMGVLLAGVALPAAAIVCGIGWLYLLRSAQVLGAGPHVQGALALKQLALADAQPLLRVLAAWALSGLAAGAALGSAAGRRAKPLVVVFGVASAVLLLIAGAASDAVVNNEPFADHLAGQLTVPALPAALAALMPAALGGALGSLALRRRSRARTPRDAAAAGPGPPPRPACTRSTS
jgi:hypothetical protein